MLTLRYVHGFKLRQVTGFMESIFKLAGIEIDVPYYTTLSRRGKNLKVILNKKEKAIIKMIIDSTGLKVFGEGEWKVRKHGWNYRRTWVKVHIGIDESGEIRAVTVTKNDVHDNTQTKKLLKQEDSEITDIYGDGAYDCNSIYTYCDKQGIPNVHISPRDNARLLARNHSERNRTLQRVKEIGKDEWKQESGYHKRSLVENTMFRFKTQFSEHLYSRNEKNQITEVLLKCNILNMFHSFNMCESYKVSV